MWPDEKTLLAAWQALVVDPTTASEFAILVHGPLTAQLTECYPFLPDEDIASSVNDAILAVIKRPKGYDPARLPPASFLLLIARRRLANHRTAEARHHRRKIPWDSVELDLPARNVVMDDDPFSFDSPELQAVIAKFSSAERAVFDLTRGGERSTAVFAAVLEIADRSTEEQETEVKRVKDRIKARFKRAREASHDD